MPTQTSGSIEATTVHQNLIQDCEASLQVLARWRRNALALHQRLTDSFQKQLVALENSASDVNQILNRLERPDERR